MILILSGSFCTEELCNEIGQIPPSFLPIGNRKLFELQCALFKNFNEEIYLSVPKSYSISKFNIRKLTKLNINLIRVPDKISISESLIFCIKNLGVVSDLNILHGDTLFGAIPKLINNFYSVAKTVEGYRWGYLSDQDNIYDKALTGYFKISNVDYFLSCLIDNSQDFVNALDQYKEKENVEVGELEEWNDFGHRNTYFTFKTKHLLTRHFNQLDVFGNYLVKKSANIEKITEEFNWYSKIPIGLSLNVPRLTSSLQKNETSAQYGLEIIPSFSLSELYVHGEKNIEFWEKKILYKIKELFLKFYSEGDKARKEGVPKEDLDNLFSSLFLKKTIMRLKLQETKTNQNLGEYKCIAENVYKYIPKTTVNHLAFSHGDFCFSNVLYDSHFDRLYMIDPRGVSGIKSNPYINDIRYDIAKVFHSFIGGYDHIIAEHYFIDKKKITFESQTENFMKFFYYKLVDLISPRQASISFKEILAINVLLFLSMVPLHSESEERQKVFLVNAKRLHDILITEV